MDLQRGNASRQVGPVDGDAPVKPAGPQQRLVQHLRPVGGGQQNDALGGVKAVHLRQQLVQCLLPLVVAAHAVVPGFADGVDLVDEHDAGGHLGRLLKEVPDAAGAHAHEHLHEVGAGDGEKRDVGFAGHSLGQQRLAGARRADQQRALGELRADLRVLLGVVQEVDDLCQGLLGLVLAGHILEGDAGGLLHIHLGVGLAHAADAAHSSHAALFRHPAHDQGEHQEDQHKGQHVAHQHGQHRVHRGLILLVDALHPILVQEINDGVIGLDPDSEQLQVGSLLLPGGVHISVAVLRLGVDGAVLSGVGIPLLRGYQEDILRVVEFHPGHLAALHHLLELSVFHVDGGGLAASAADDAAGIAEDDRQQKGPAHQRGHAPPVAAGLVVFVVLIVVWVHVWNSFQGKTCQYPKDKRDRPGPACAGDGGAVRCPGASSPVFKQCRSLKMIYKVYHRSRRPTRTRNRFSINFL